MSTYLSIKQTELDLSEIKPDSTELGHIADDQTLEPPSDDDEDYDDEVVPPTTNKHPHLSKPKTTNTEPEKPTRLTSQTDSTPTVRRPKLRPASDILSRLRWDPSLSSEPHTIGYLDRFAGVQEITVEAWKGDSSAEDFIPEHRILWFRRVADGVLVWDREARVDMIFGSGNGREGAGKVGIQCWSLDHWDSRALANCPTLTAAYNVPQHAQMVTSDPEASCLTNGGAHISILQQSG